MKTLLSEIKRLCAERKIKITHLARDIGRQKSYFYEWIHTKNWYDKQMRQDIELYLQTSLEPLIGQVSVERTLQDNPTTDTNAFQLSRSPYGSFRWAMYTFLLKNRWSVLYLAEQCETTGSHLVSVSSGSGRLNPNVYNKLCELDLSLFKSHLPWRTFTPKSAYTDAKLRKLIALGKRTQEQIEDEYPLLKKSYKEAAYYLDSQFYTEEEIWQKAVDR